VIGRRKLEQAIVTSSVPGILETVRRLSPQQRVLASLDRRSAELFGGLPAALDRFAAIGNCMVAVEKGLLADSLELCLQRVGGDYLGAWVSNDADDIAQWLARPIRQITTDRPDVALRLRAR
jgi:glycerophosphoryl diester phosphodiesterase